MGYYVDTSYFDHLTPESAYWLGFLHADGCVFTRRGGREWLMQLRLQRADAAHVLALREALRYEGQLKHPTEDSAAIMIYSKELCLSLGQLGMHPRKSYGTSRVPTILSVVRLQPPFCQGYFDGNGCVSVDKHGPKISVSGPADHVEWFRRQVALHVDEVRAGSTIEKQGCNEHIWHGRRQCAALAEWLAMNYGAPRLQRKVDALEALLEVCHC